MRAVAVLGVLLFHVGWDAIPGGFLGVDVFFVISGFLITRNILTDLQSGDFSFRRFYLRRVRRLGPALLVTILGSLLAAAWWFAPDETLGLAKSAIAAELGVSNLWFWSQISYFDPAALAKPLLHTWSLGVEEQYYLLSPAVLFLAHRFLARDRLIWLVMGCAAVSLGAAALLVRVIPSAVFYWMPFRVFEFAIGGAIAVPPISGRNLGRWAGLAFLAGMGLIAASMLLLDGSMPMPGLLALLPCVGTGLVILAGNPPIVGRLLSNPVAGLLGRISYSLYLVHWPVVVFYAYAVDAAPAAIDRTDMLAISLALGVLLFALVEAPFRGTGTFLVGANKGARFRQIALGAGLVAVVAVSSVATGGWRFRLSQELPPIQDAQRMWQERPISERMKRCFLADTPDTRFSQFDQQYCLGGVIEGETILVVGDSFSADLYSALTQAYPDADFVLATAGNCTPRMDNKGKQVCRDLLGYVFSDFVPNHKLRAVVLAGNWGYDDIDAAAATARYVQQYAPVVIASPPIRFKGAVPDLIFRAKARTIAEAEADVYAQRYAPDFHVWIAQRLAAQSGASLRYLDLQELILARGPRLFTENREPIFIDFAHLTRAGSRYLSRRIAAAYPRASDLFPPSP